MSQKYRRSKKYGNYKKYGKLVSLEEQIALQAVEDSRQALIEKVKKREEEAQQVRELREAVWEDDFEFGGAL